MAFPQNHRYIITEKGREVALGGQTMAKYELTAKEIKEVRDLLARERPGAQVDGAEIEVPEFFWIKPEELIGFDDDAAHGNRIKGGSVSPGCTLIVRGIEDGFAVVRLNRSRMPYGDPAAIGTVFKIDLRRLAAWAWIPRGKGAAKARRPSLAEKYCR